VGIQGDQKEASAESEQDADYHCHLTTTLGRGDCASPRIRTMTRVDAVLLGGQKLRSLWNVSRFGELTVTRGSPSWQATSSSSWRRTRTSFHSGFKALLKRAAMRS
jgi:hypothetical protein